MIFCLLFFDAIRLIPQENAHFCEVKHAKSKNEHIFFIGIKGTDPTYIWFSIQPPEILLKSLSLVATAYKKFLPCPFLKMDILNMFFQTFLL